MTTFKTLNQTQGSIVIEEYQEGSRYTKCILLKFDEKAQYVIRSYRAEELKKEPHEGIIIQKIE